MVLPNSQPQLAQLPRDLGEPGVRWLGPGDGALLVDLIRACYGETYSYRELYEPDAIEARWARGELLSLAHVDAQGRLDGHTGFLRKDPKHEYVESALSLIRPGARRGFAVEPGPMWRALLSAWAQEVAFIHQNTTTRHPRAQLYAARYMRARATGWVFDYALAETIVGLAETPAPMHALTMSTVLEPSPLARPLAVPDGPWHTWLARLVRGVLPEATVVPVPCANVREPWVLTSIENNPSLGLRRQGVESTGEGGGSQDATPSRVDLVHLPMRPALVRAAWRGLQAGGYVPVGLRPHRHRDCEIVLQRIELERGREALETMVLTGNRVRELASGWLEACTLTS